MKFSDGSRNKPAGPESAFDAPSTQLTLRLYAVTNGMGGGAQTDFVPWPEKPKVRHCLGVHEPQSSKFKRAFMHKIFIVIALSIQLCSN